MQTWAKRGVQAALVTGGMLAVGTGVASASGTCPDRPAPPLGESALTPATDDGTPRESGRCFEGELFPDESHQPTQVNRPVVSPAERASGHQMTGMSGTIDPVRDMLPAVENDVTKEMPALTDQFWIPPQPAAPEPRHAAPAPAELAGWVADTVDSPQRIPLQPSALLTRPVVSGVPALGTPAEGFQRSLTWAGPIGDVIKGLSGSLAEVPLLSEHAAPELVVPTGDPVIAEGFEQAEGIVALWQGALGRSAHGLAEGLVAPGELDLTSGDLRGPAAAQHTVPNPVVASALSSAPRAAAAAHEFVPLQVPGERQEKATDLPDLSKLPLPLLSVSKTPGTEERSGEQDPGVTTPLPGLGKLNAFGGGQTSAPAVSRITEALQAPKPAPAGRAADTAAPAATPAASPAATPAAAPTEAPAFSRVPELASVAVTVVDELTAAAPEQQQVTQNPFATPAPRAEPRGGMALPLLGGGAVPDITAVQGETLPLPGLQPGKTPLVRNA